jgi:uncharacterized membrane protein YjgN (DUF898 family)
MGVIAFSIKQEAFRLRNGACPDTPAVRTSVPAPSRPGAKFKATATQKALLMTDVVLPPMSPPGVMSADPQPALVTGSASSHTLPITFTGSGSEYFRIWIVNLLLTIVTLGLYFPWAKVRRLRYFYGNTLVGGHALDFHGEPKRMLRGFLLVGVMGILYGLAGKVSVAAGVVALLIVAGLWPALFRASQQFRLANTSWRGLRFRFVGNRSGAYRAMLPLFVPAALSLMLSWSYEEGKGAQSTSLLLSASFFVSLLFVPLLLWMLKKYQHDNLALGQIQTRFSASAGSYYAIALKTVGVAICTFLVVGLAVGVVSGIDFSGVQQRNIDGRFSTAMIFGLLMGLFLAYLAALLVIQPYATSRLQNLVWNHTANPEVRFESSLRFWKLLRLTLKNMALSMLTLGLYLPFAKVAMARLRLEAVTVHPATDPDAWVGALQARADDASGDAAADFFGVDIGL